MGQMAGFAELADQEAEKDHSIHHHKLLSESRTLNLAAQILREHEKIAHQKTI